MCAFWCGSLRPLTQTRGALRFSQVAGAHHRTPVILYWGIGDCIRRPAGRRSHQAIYNLVIECSGGTGVPPVLTCGAVPFGQVAGPNHRPPVILNRGLGYCIRRPAGRRSHQIICNFVIKCSGGTGDLPVLTCCVLRFSQVTGANHRTTVILYWCLRDCIRRPAGRRSHQFICNCVIECSGGTGIPPVLTRGVVRVGQVAGLNHLASVIFIWVLATV